MTKQQTCSLCGEPMPPGEEMFKYHGYSGPCPKPMLPPQPEGGMGVHRPVLNGLLCPKCDGITVEHTLSYVKELTMQRDCLLAALKAIVETGDDCPACDRGVLRHPENGHWPTCPFGHAQVAITAVEGKP